MNITFLVGNGFDINLGLKTRYTDFYPYFLAHGQKGIITDDITENYDCWADMVCALGKLLSKVSPEQIQSFLDQKASLENCLADYLRNEEKRIDLSSPTIQKEFQKNLSELYTEFSQRDRDNYLFWQKQIADKIIYQFISFNYTSTLDQIIRPAKLNKQFATHSTSYTSYYDIVGTILHLHGTLSEGLILALDNEKQIENPDLQENADLVDYMIKSKINDSLGELKTEVAKKIINGSDYVFIYGMSLGATDAMWWNYLAVWLNEKNTRRLVLYAYEKPTGNPSGPEKLRQQDKWKNVFLTAAGVKKEAWSNLRSRIIVVLQSKIFDFSGVKLVDKETKTELVGV